MTGAFSGWTADQYAAHRRDLPEIVVADLVSHFGLDLASSVVDLGSGTGQAIAPLSRRVGVGIAIEPEPDMLRRLRERTDVGSNVLTILGSDHDLPLLRNVLGDRRVDLVTVANALHFMDPAAVFADALSVLRPGGGIAVISHGWPLWLADSDWSRAVRAFLEQWLGHGTARTCGLDEQTLHERESLLTSTGFVDVTVSRHEYTTEVTPDYVVGNLASALSDEQVPAARRSEFEAGVRTALAQGAGSLPLEERVPIVVLAARAPS
ncbi:class I SAM-dependent methyltransferase [Planctomonas sp. JC2975]|uniref:class I SAM-dependent methyltransferase n=1 Tax=Planctomonas sp. JC2975 TaxID=2729626 RepID=UPI0014733DC9|nr:class I SAM-dependent methyltransferase [Planctomonas sp. JC2975]NNC12292.1 class I SAM-dependent methyltransferase [Planctomonas sp. JC2975]